MTEPTDDTEPREQRTLRCGRCESELRASALFCDRCGAPANVRSRPGAGPPGPHWSVVAILAFAVGLLLGALTLAIAFPAAFTNAFNETPVRESGEVETGENQTASSATPSAAVANSGAKPVSDPVAPASRDTTFDPGDTITAAAPPPLDTTPDGLRAAFANAALTIVGFDENQERLPPAPAAAITPSLLVVPFSAIEGASGARVIGANRQSWPVAGIIRHDAIVDVALLEVVGDLPAALPGIRTELVPSNLPVTVLGSAEDGSVMDATLQLTQGPPDPLTGGPRLKFDGTPDTPGIVLDEQGLLIGLLPRLGDAVLQVYPTAEWAGMKLASIPLDAFRRTTGPGSPASRVRAARKLVAQRRYLEATRSFLTILGAEPRLLDEVASDLSLASREAARESISVGNGYAAVEVLTQTLSQLPADPDLFAVRGRAFALTDNVTAALVDLKHAADLDPTRADGFIEEARGILLNVINTLVQQDRLSEASTLILNERRGFPKDGELRMTGGTIFMSERRFSDAAALFDEAALVDVTLAGRARVEARRARDLVGGPGAIGIDFTPGSDDIVVRARLNASAEAMLRVDPGERFVVLSEASARAAGYMVGATPRIRISSDLSADEVPSVKLDALSVNGVSQRDVQAIFIDGYAAPIADGVLGNSFLSRFRIVTDRDLGRMVLHPR